MRYLIVLGTLLLLSGCGSGGGSSVPTVSFPVVNTDRAGTWSGRATDAVTNTSGVLTLTVDDAGAVRGTWRTDGGVLWTVAGNFELPPFNDTALIAFDAPGQATINERGTLDVGISGRFGGVIKSIVNGTMNRPVLVSEFRIDLTRQ